VVATEVCYWSVISNEVETLLKPRFRPWTEPRRKKRRINCSRGDDKQPIAQRCTKTSRSKSCNPVQYDATVRRSAGVWRRERKAVYIRAAPCARSRSNNEATGCRAPHSTPPLLPNFYDRLCNLDGPCNPPFQPLRQLATLRRRVRVDAVYDSSFFRNK